MEHADAMRFCLFCGSAILRHDDQHVLQQGGREVGACHRLCHAMYQLCEWIGWAQQQDGFLDQSEYDTILHQVKGVIYTFQLMHPRREPFWS